MPGTRKTTPLTRAFGDEWSCVRELEMVWRAAEGVPLNGTVVEGHKGRRESENERRRILKMFRKWGAGADSGMSWG